MRFVWTDFTHGFFSLSLCSFFSQNDFNTGLDLSEARASLLSGDVVELTNATSTDSTSMKLVWEVSISKTLLTSPAPQSNFRSQKLLKQFAPKMKSLSFTRSLAKKDEAYKFSKWKEHTMQLRRSPLLMCKCIHDFHLRSNSIHRQIHQAERQRECSSTKY